MKKVIVFFLLMIGATSYGQTTYGSFKTENQEIIFQKVLDQDSITLKKLEDFYSGLPYVSDLKENTNTLEFTVNDITVDYLKFQYSQIATPKIMQTGHFSGKVSVAAREGRYRVSMNDVMMTGDMGYEKLDNKTALTGFATVNSGTALNRDWCRPNMLGLLEMAFTDKLQYVPKEGGDW